MSFDATMVEILAAKHDQLNLNSRHNRKSGSCPYGRGRPNDRSQRCQRCPKVLSRKVARANIVPPRKTQTKRKTAKTNKSGISLSVVCVSASSMLRNDCTFCRRCGGRHPGQACPGSRSGDGTRSPRGRSAWASFRQCSSSQYLSTEGVS